MFKLNQGHIIPLKMQDRVTSDRKLIWLWALLFRFRYKQARYWSNVKPLNEITSSILGTKNFYQNRFGILKKVFQFDCICCKMKYFVKNIFLKDSIFIFSLSQASFIIKERDRIVSGSYIKKITSENLHLKYF